MSELPGLFAPSTFVQEQRTEADWKREWHGADNNKDWVHAQLASEWAVRFSFGRSDQDLADTLGCSESYVKKHRAVWDKFEHFYLEFPNLYFSHFIAALGWEDWLPMLRWANATGESVAKMHEYRQSLCEKAAMEGIETVPVEEKPRGRVAGQTSRKTAVPIIYAESAPLAIVTDLVQVGSSVTPDPDPFELHTVITKVRSVLTPVLNDADAEERQEIYDELLAWLVRLCPDKPLPQQSAVTDITNVPVVVDAWNNQECVAYVDSVSSLRRRQITKMLENETWRATWRVALEKLAELAKKWPDWKPQLHWFLRNTTVKKLLRGDFDQLDAPPTPSKQFAPPTVAEVQAYCESRRDEGNRVDAQAFVDYYTSQGWVKANGRDLKEWKAAVRTWEAKDKNRQPGGFSRGSASAFDDVLARGHQAHGDDSPWGQIMDQSGGSA